MSTLMKLAAMSVAVVQESAPDSEPEAAASPEANNGSAEQAIRARAHEIYLERLAAGWLGDANSDWFEAEHELSRGGAREPVLVSAPG